MTSVGEALVFYSKADNADDWLSVLRPHLPDLDMRVAPDVGDPLKVRYAIVWKPPLGFFTPFTNLKLVVNLGAGVDALVARDDLPNVPVTRLSDPQMSRMMASFVLMSVLRHARDIPVFEKAQREKRWHYVHPRTAGEITVGVMGLGELGSAAVLELSLQGFEVRGWSRNPKKLPGIHTSHGLDKLPAFLAECEILVVMLPLTRETYHMLNAERLALLPRGAKFINVARGPVVDEKALIAALTSGHLSQATLDVFEHEPLPQDSPLWEMENVLITPHLASVAIPRTAALQVAENIRRVRSGAPILHRVDPGRGY